MHGISVVHENIDYARQHNLKYLAVTDHFYYPEDRISRLNEIARTTDISKFKEIKPVRVIGGVETNLNHSMPYKDADKVVTSVPWRLVGFHSWFLDPKTLAPGGLPQYFSESLQSRNRIRPTAFAHIERGLEPLCHAYGCDQVNRVLRDIVDIAIENDIYLEINDSSITRGTLTRDFMRNWIAYAKERKAKFCLGTDAHYCSLVGDFSRTLEFLDMLDMGGVYFLNCDPQALEALFKANGKGG